MVLRRLKQANGGISVPEVGQSYHSLIVRASAQDGHPQMRLRSTVIGMPFVVASFLAYAWTADKKVNIAGIIISLFFCGLFLM